MMIYIDMDGVIANFSGWMKQHIPDLDESMWKGTGRPWKVMKENYKDVYLNLEPLHLLSYANHMYNNLERVKFLTAIPHSWWDTQEGEQAMINKRLWLERYIDNFSYEDVIFTAGAKDKIKYVEENAVLYDDRQDTIDAWNEAGGTGIHVKGR
jgi:hypothetical protein|tara:strand:+ start:1512 stop:1970 length:459 start_codon:yes stop_codon:yes gene_type:complete